MLTLPQTYLKVIESLDSQDWSKRILSIPDLGTFKLSDTELKEFQLIRVRDDIYEQRYLHLSDTEFRNALLAKAVRFSKKDAFLLKWIDPKYRQYKLDLVKAANMEKIHFYHNHGLLGLISRYGTKTLFDPLSPDFGVMVSIWMAAFLEGKLDRLITFLHTQGFDEVDKVKQLMKIRINLLKGRAPFKVCSPI